MSDLLSDVLAAHGGLDRWKRVTALEVEGSLGGPFWGAKGWPDVYKNQRITLSTRRVDITFSPFPAVGQLSRFQAMPERLEIRDDSGDVRETRDRPRDTFPPTDAPSQWDAIQTAYFTSCASWNYFTEPFLFTYPGVTSREMAPWIEDGYTWRRLAVTFPPELPNHNRDQTFYFDDDLLLRRMDYHPDVTGAAIAHYTDEHRIFGGFVFPTRRRVHVHDGDGRTNKSITPITIDVDTIRVLTDDDERL